MTMPCPVLPVAHTSGARTLLTPYSMVPGASRLAGGASSIHFEGAFDSMIFTSERSARSSTSDLSPLATMTFATQKDLCEMFREASIERSEACVRSACSLSVSET